MKSFTEIAKSLLRLGEEWLIDQEIVDEKNKSYHVYISYKKSANEGWYCPQTGRWIKQCGYRKKGVWHLDHKGYKWFIYCRVPQIESSGIIRAIEVPWENISNRATHSEDGVGGRKWKLPGVQDTTKDQERALFNSAHQGQHLIVGGPGTGKTVVMVMRGMELKNQREEYTFLVYNHMLSQASYQMDDKQGGNRIKSSTWMSWFYSKFYRLTGEFVPNLEPHFPDWEKCMLKIEPYTCQDSRDKFFLIDEGQDMPPEFYRILIKLGYENFLVAADQNQQINVGRESSIQDIKDELAIETKDVIELKHNFRNNYGVARLAREFYTGDPATPPPELPEKPRGKIHIPKLYGFEDSQDVHRQIAEKIVRFFQRDEKKLIGVFTSNDLTRKRYLHALRRASIRLIGDSLRVHSYRNEDRQEIRFDQGGFVVLNAQSCKGLEFDTVILADIDEYNVTHEHKDDVKKLFYVMISRARDRVFLLIRSRIRRDPTDPPAHSICSILPKDPDVLCWKYWDKSGFDE